MITYTQKPRSFRTSRTVLALILREMSTTYGRSAMGYLWAILEPVAGLLLLTFVFSLAFQSPPLGNSFPAFYASGLLPFMAYQDISQKVSVSLRFSKALLAFPAVTYIDAIIARLILSAFTQMLVMLIVFGGLIFLYRVDVIIDVQAVTLGILMAIALGAGIGTLNCFLLSVFPVWERTWAVLNRPLLIVSCVVFLFEAVPNPYRGYLWFNPLVHVTGQLRKGIYQTYDGAYVSPVFVFGVSLALTALGLILLRRYHRDIMNF